MTAVDVRGGPLFGACEAPPSKSYTHRALVAGFLAERRYEVVNPLDCDDTRATGEGLVRLGASLGRSSRVWEIEAGSPAARSGSPRTIRCGASGTTLRFLLPLAARDERRVRFVGSKELALRPLGPLLSALESGGVRIERGRRSGDIVAVRGPIDPLRASLDGSSSSQFLSALLLTLPTLRGPSRLRRTGRLVSEPYVAATLEVIRAHRVRIHARGRELVVPAPQTFVGRRFQVPGDASSAAYLWAAAALGGGRVTVRGVPADRPQADLAVLPLLRRMGARVRRSGDQVDVTGPVRHPIDLDLDPAPDLLPLATVLAAHVEGTSRLRGARHARGKESDRRRESARLSRALGARVRLAADQLTVRGTSDRTPFRYAGPADHRLVMSAAVAALARPGVSRIGPSDAVRKSFPKFWSCLRSLGAQVRFAA